MNAEPKAPAGLYAGKYNLVRLLGKGAMGEVWLAEEQGPRNFKRRVAVKKLLSVTEISEYATDSFVAEAQVIARLDHPNIVRLIEFGAANGALFLVLDYVDGPALDKMLKKGPLSAKAVTYIGREISRALEAVHTMCDEEGKNYGVVHRDVTPSNMLVSRDGRVRLTDFGVARISGLGGDKTETGVFKGKLPYMPPEQARGEAFDGRADIFSLAVSLFEACIGRRLRRAESQAQLIMKIAHESLPRMTDLFPAAPPLLAAAIDSATEVDIGMRTSDSGAFAAQLAEALQSFGPGAEREAMLELRERVKLVLGASGPPSLAMTPTSSYGPPRPSGAGQPDPEGSFSAPAAGADWSVPMKSSSGVEANPEAHGFVPPGVPLDQPTSEPSIRSAISVRRHIDNDASTVDDGSPRTARIKTETLQRKTSTSTIVLSSFIALLIGALAAVLFYRSGSPAETKKTADDSAARSATPTPSAVAPKSTAATPASAEAAATVEAAPSAHEEPEPSKERAGPKKAARPVAVRAAPRPAPSAGEDTSNPGTLQVVVLPWADVTVDGRGVGTTPIAPIPLSPGPHSVVLKNSELGATRALGVNIKPGKPTLLRVDLRKADP